MDINSNITRNKKKKEEEKVAAKTIFSLSCKVDEVSNTEEQEDFKIYGKVKADKMDSDLMASILCSIIKQCTPEEAIEEVLDLTAEKLGFVDANKEDAGDCDGDHCKPRIEVHKHTINKENAGDFLKFLNKLLGE